MKKIIKSKGEMTTFARQIAKGVRGGEVIALEGPLGAGKTFFTQALGKALGVKQTVTSPTFVLMNIYPIRNSQSAIRNLVHIDCYRLDDPQELFYLGAQEWMGREDSVIIVEWADKAHEFLKKMKKLIRIRISPTNNFRTLVITPRRGTPLRRS